jgi:integrase
MAARCTVRLSSNNGYWQAFFYDTLGRRKARSLGAKSEISRRQALVLCERLAIELNAQPQRADVGRAPTISEWVKTFVALKPDLGDKARRAYRIAGDKFIEFVGGHTRLDRITASIAAEWVTRLSAPVTIEKDGTKTEKRLAPATIANYSRHVRCLFNEAMHQGVLVANPFARVRTQPRKVERSWHYVNRELFTRLLNACRNDGWRCFLALQRIAALRKGESLEAEWRMIDWERRVLTLPESVTKTGQERAIPLDPELFDLLKATRAKRIGTDSLIVPLNEVDRASDSNQHSRFRVILKKAGVAPWEDLFQTLRRNAVQDLREMLKDPWAVTAIAGHSEEVQRKYYLGHVRQADLDRITGKGGDDPQISELMELWSKLKPEQRSKLLALMRATTSAAATATKTATNPVSDTLDVEVQKQKKPGIPGSNRSAPRRTRTFDPLIKSQLLYQLS